MKANNSRARYRGNYTMTLPDPQRALALIGERAGELDCLRVTKVWYPTVKGGLGFQLLFLISVDGNYNRPLPAILDHPDTAPHLLTSRHIRPHIQSLTQQAPSKNVFLTGLETKYSRNTLDPGSGCPRHSSSRTGLSVVVSPAATITCTKPKRWGSIAARTRETCGMHTGDSDHALFVISK